MLSAALPSLGVDAKVIDVIPPCILFVQRISDEVYRVAREWLHRLGLAEPEGALPEHLDHARPQDERRLTCRRGDLAPT
jgi:hypothetical protein